MDNQDAPPGGYQFIVQNSRSTSMVLIIEPWGFAWEMAPGDKFEITFEKQSDFCSGSEPLEFTEEGVTFWGAYPTSVAWLRPKERIELMR